MPVAVGIGIAVAGLAIGLALGYWLPPHGRLSAKARPLTVRRILLPFTGQAISRRSFEAAVRLAKAENATIMPAYLARVPRNLPLDAPLPRQAAVAMPLLEMIEQRTTSQGIAVDSRVARGRTYRDALRRLLTRSSSIGSSSRPPTARASDSASTTWNGSSAPSPPKSSSSALPPPTRAVCLPAGLTDTFRIPARAQHLRRVPDPDDAPGRRDEVSRRHLLGAMVTLTRVRDCTAPVGQDQHRGSDRNYAVDRGIFRPRRSASRSPIHRRRSRPRPRILGILVRSAQPPSDAVKQLHMI
jgi:hypothetical protein